MRKSLLALFAVLACSATAFAQMGGPGGPSLDTSLNQLFDKTPVFTATMQTVMSGPSGSITAITKMIYDHGNSRFEMDAANAHGSMLPPNALAQAKALGMDKVITIVPANGANGYTIYPNLHGYISTPTPSNSAQKNRIQVTKLGAETVAGHLCIKNQVLLASPGQPPLTVWNATDLNNFPIQITVSDQGSSATMNFQNISFGRVAASEFYPPANYKHYDNAQEVLQAAIISHVGGGTPATPPARQ